jgi:hypothetical protein
MQDKNKCKTNKGKEAIIRTIPLTYQKKYIYIRKIQLQKKNNNQ